MQEIDIIFSIVILIMSAVIHEVSHGFMANYLGDPTAKYEGRLTLNPFKHLDFFGSFLVPLVTYLATINVGGFIFGWAKPVPYNPYNLKNPKTGAGLIAVAGPFINFVIAVFFGLVIRFFVMRYDFNSSVMFSSLFFIFGKIVGINILLGVFNLIPIPPLDGSKVLFSFLPNALQGIMDFLERFGFFFLLIIIFFFSGWVLPIAQFLSQILTGKVFSI